MKKIEDAEIYMNIDKTDKGIRMPSDGWIEDILCVGWFMLKMVQKQLQSGY